MSYELLYICSFHERSRYNVYAVRLRCKRCKGRMVIGRLENMWIRSLL
jgi:hypothetical protein